MTLQRLEITPLQAGYAVVHGTETLSVRLDGGSSRFRRDILGSSDILNVRWNLNSLEFEYIQAFYRNVTKNGSEPFLIYTDKSGQSQISSHSLIGPS